MPKRIMVKHIKVADNMHHAISIYAAVKGLNMQDAADELLRRGLAQTEQGLAALALVDSEPDPQGDLGLIPQPKE